MHAHTYTYTRSARTHTHTLIPSMLLQGKQKDLSLDGVDDLRLVEVPPILHDMLDDVVPILVLQKRGGGGEGRVI